MLHGYFSIIAKKMSIAKLTDGNRNAILTEKCFRFSNPAVERNMNRYQRPKCPICGEPIYHDNTPYGAAPLNDLDACYECTQEALKDLMKKKGIPLPTQRKPN